MNAEFHEQWREKFAAVIEALRFIVNDSDDKRGVRAGQRALTSAQKALEALWELGFEREKQMTMDNDDLQQIGNSIDEIKRLASYVDGFAAAQQNIQLARVAWWLDKLSRHVCGHGYIGCPGGYKCSSDHK